MKKNTALFLFPFIFLVLNNASPLSAVTDNDSEKMRLAIVDLIGNNVSKVISIAVTDLIRSDMVDTGRFIVVERSQMDAIFKEHELQQTGCTDSACAVEMGKLLSANKVMIGEINKLESDYIITVRIVDVEKGVAEFSTNEKATNIDEIDKTVKILVEKLTVRITGKKSLAGETGASSFYLRGIVPGWGQIYAGKKTKGAIFMGGFALTGGIWTYSYFNYKDKKDAYDSLGPKDSKDKFSSCYKDYKQSYNIMIYLAGIWGLIYAANWIDMLFFTDSPGIIISGMPCSYAPVACINNGSNYSRYHTDEFSLYIGYKINF